MVELRTQNWIVFDKRKPIGKQNMDTNTYRDTQKYAYTLSDS